LGGVKAALCTGWIIFSLIIFWGIIVFSISKTGVAPSSSPSLVRISYVLSDFYIYLFAAIIVFVLLLILSTNVWEYLDQRFPSKDNSSIPVSQILKPPEVP